MAIIPFAYLSRIPSKFMLGSIVYSLDDLATFTTKHGPGWVEMTGQSIAGSLFAQTSGINTLPDARDKFLRGLPSSGRTLGDTQGWAIQDHTHTRLSASGGANNTGNQAGGNDHTNTSFNNYTGSTEASPRNIALYGFIKIN